VLPPIVRKCAPNEFSLPLRQGGKSDDVPNGSLDYIQHLLMSPCDVSVDAVMADSVYGGLPPVKKRRSIETLSLSDFCYPTMKDIDPFWSDDRQAKETERAMKRLKRWE